MTDDGTTVTGGLGPRTGVVVLRVLWVGASPCAAHDGAMRAPRTGEPRGAAAGAGVVAAVVTVVLLLAGAAFHPFHLDLPGPRANGAERTPAGLSFSAPSEAITASGPPWMPAAIGGADLDVHVEARSRRADQVGPARVFAVAADHRDGSLAITQYHQDLIVRVRRSGSDGVGEPPVRVPAVFTPGRWVAIDVHRRAQHVVVTVDGVDRGEVALGSSGLRTWDPEHRVSLGNDPAGDRQWVGDLRAATVVVAGGRWDYVHDDLLRIPRTIWYLPERIRSPFASGSGGAPAAAAHLASFVPFGALVALTPRGRRSAVAAVAIAAALATILAAGKIAFAGRHPSLIDVAIQTTGATLGVASVRAITVLRAPRAARAQRPRGCAPACGDPGDRTGAR